MWWEQLAGSSVFWTAVTAIATAAAAVVAIITLLALRADSADRTRPVVVADLEHPPAVYGNMGLDLVVRNTGATAARNLRVSFEPDPLIIDETGQEKPRDRRQADRLVKRFSRPLSVLPARRRLRTNYFWSGTDPETGKGRNANPLPDRFTVKLSYRGRGRKQFTDDFDLDVWDFEDSRMYDSSSQEKLRDIHRAIMNLTHKLDHWASGPPWSLPIPGLPRFHAAVRGAVDLLLGLGREVVETPSADPLPGLPEPLLLHAGRNLGGLRGGSRGRTRSSCSTRTTSRSGTRRTTTSPLFMATVAAGSTSPRSSRPERSTAPTRARDDPARVSGEPRRGYQAAQGGP